MITTINEWKKDLNSNYGNLYHGINMKYVKNILENNKMPYHTVQRYWPDGKHNARKKDDMEGYNESHYYAGLSLTRDIDYAKNWSDVIFVFDKNSLINKYKLLPINWGHSIGNGYKQKDIKREREEFLICKKLKPMSNKELANNRNTPYGYIENISKYLKGFYLIQEVIDIFGEDNNDIIYLKNNEKCLGIL
jgi:hypothetical protein